MRIMASVSVLAVSFLVLITENSFVFTVDFHMFIKTVFLFLTVTLLKVFALELFVTGMVWIGIKFLCIIFPAY